jgi:hypothetical protein
MTTWWVSSVESVQISPWWSSLTKKQEATCRLAKKDRIFDSIGALRPKSAKIPSQEGIYRENQTHRSVFNAGRTADAALFC